ncbi:protein NLRC3-like, partial [Trifolium medium]|nr:protein NLRC3-like [Trifolium medium]
MSSLLLWVSDRTCRSMYLTPLTVIWKLAEKFLAPTPKQSKSPTAESQSASQGLKWSFAAGTNLLSQFGAKIERQSKQKLNEFARELRSFPFIDMS